MKFSDFIRYANEVSTIDKYSPHFSDRFSNDFIENRNEQMERYRRIRQQKRKEFEKALLFGITDL